VSRDAGVGRPISRWLAHAVLAVVWFLGAVTLLALLDRLSAYLELLTFFRVQYAALLLVAGVIALAVRLPRVALAALALAAVNLAVVAPTWFPPRGAEPAPGSGSLTLLVLNLEDGNPRHADVARLIDETKPDVVGLLELTPVWAGGLAPALDRFPHRRLSPESGAYGIGLYSKLAFRQATLKRFPRDGPVSVVARFDLGGDPFTLVLTHVHTPFAGDIHRRQFEALADARDELGSRLAICGDLNSVPWSASFRHLASAGGLTDSHRGQWLEGSWPSWGMLIRVPIDNCLISPGVTVLEQAYGEDVGSDHFPLLIRFGLSATPAASETALDQRLRSCPCPPPGLTCRPSSPRSRRRTGCSCSRSSSRSRTSTESACPPPDLPTRDGRSSS
jgi:endonuclease/exonuclease/phosphatase (EEP) superfamily protein YafD